MTGRRKASPEMKARLVEDGTGLLITPPSRFAESTAGLLVAVPAGAVTADAAPADGDEPARHPDPWEEQRLNAAADLARWEHRIEAGARKALSAWTAVVATAVLDDQYLLAAPDGGLPPDPGAIPALASTWQRIANTHIVRLVSDLLGEVFARFLSDEQVVSARPWQDNYLENVANRLVSVADSTFDVVRRVVQDGIADGASIPELRDAVQESLDAGGETSWANRARTIARTETIGAYNGGHLAAWQAVEELTDEPTDKVWLATIDPRTRDTHFAADGQRRRLGVPFNVGLALLEHPGDPTGPAGEVINCRCTMLELDPDEETPDVAERGFRDPAEVQAEIARRAGLDPAVIRAFEDPDAPAPVPGLLAAAKPAELVRPPEDVVARMDAIFRASYDDPDPLLVDEGVIDQDLLAAILGGTLTAASVGAIFGGDHYDPNQRRDENGKWTKRGVGISITVKDGPDEEASFAEPTEALARVTFEHELTGSDGRTYRSRVSEVDTRDGLMSVVVRFEDDQGRGIGKAERTVRLIPGGPQMYHDSLKIVKGSQGLGLASEFNQRAEAVYRAAGITHVATQAYSAPALGMVGGYVWARRGFSWADHVGPRRAAKNLGYLAPKAHRTPEVQAMIDRLSAAEPGGTELSDLPTPFEVSELRGIMRDTEDDRLGRAALLETIWDGVRWLPPEESSPAKDRVEDKAATVVPAAPAPVAVTVDGAHDAKATAKAAGHAAPALTRAEADRMLSALVTEDLSPEADMALQSYIGAGYRSLNDHLRGIDVAQPGKGGVHQDVLDEITELRGVADAHRLTAPIESWRGLYGVEGILPARGQAVGAVVTDPGFMSTSIDPAVAGNFGHGETAALLRLTVPAGHPAIPVDQLFAGHGEELSPDEEREFELVLPPGSSFRITGETEDPDGRRVITGEVLPYGADPVATPAPGGVPAITEPPAAPEPPAAAPEPLRGEDAYLAVNALAASELEPGTPEKAALRTYAGSQYQAINFALRAGSDEHLPAEAREVLASTVSTLDSLADRHRLNEPVVVHRGITNADTVIPEGSAIGTVVTDLGFMSTSTSAGDAGTFARDTRRGAVLNLTAPAGHPVIPIDGLLGDRGEDEVVLARGSSFRITGDERDGQGRRVITGEVLPYSPPAAADAPAEPDVPAPATPAELGLDPLAEPHEIAAAEDAAAPPAPLAGDEAYRAAQSALSRDLSSGERRALESYTGSGADAMNAHLRGAGTDPKQQAMVEDLTALAVASPLPEPVRVYRGIHHASTVLSGDDLTGATITDRAFVSTTTDVGVADLYAQDTYGSGAGPDDAVILDITVPAGYPSVPVDQALAGHGKAPGSSYLTFQKEVILPPGSSFRVTGDARNADGVRVLSAEALPYSPPAAGEASAPDAADDAPAAQRAAGLTGDELDALRPTDAAQIKAVERYTGRSYSSINRNLREGKPTAATNATVRNLDAAMQPMPRDATVYRRVDFAPFGGRAPEVGDEFMDAGFTSTTWDNELAKGQLSSHVLMELTVREGTPALNAAVGIHSEEMELLIARGARVRVTGVEDVTDEAREARRAEWEAKGITAQDLPYRQYRVRAELDLPGDEDTAQLVKVPPSAVDVPPAADVPVPDGVAPEAPAPAPIAPAAGLPPIKLTAARAQALDFYAADPGDRKGKGPNYSVYMPLLKAGLLERADGGKYVLSDAGRAAHAGLPADGAGVPTEAVASAPDLTPAAPAVAAPAGGTPLAGPDAYAALPRVPEHAPAAHAKALAEYQGAGYSRLNQDLRADGEPSKHMASLAADLDEVLAAHTLDQPITVHRGSGSASAILGSEPLAPGSVITDPGYLSTSTDPAVASKFVLFTSDPVIFTIDVPAGSHTVAVVGNEGYEAEALLPRGTQLRVVSDAAERQVVNPDGYRMLGAKATKRGWSADELEAEARRIGIVADVRTVRAEVAPVEPPRAAAPDAAAPDLGDEVAAAREAATAARAAEVAAATAKAEKKAAAASKRAEKKRAKEEAARAKEMADGVDAAGVPRTLTYDYLSGLSEEEREDVEVHLINGVASGDPLDEKRLEDLVLFNEGQAVEDEMASQEDQLGTAGVSREIARWQDAHGRPGLTHSAVGGPAADDGYNPLGTPSFKQVQQEYADFLHEQLVKAENATNGYLVTERGRRIGRSPMDMFSGKRGVADVMQYATPELLEWFEQPENRRIAWAEFYYERTKAPGFAARAAKARAVSLQINRDRTALKADAALLELLAELSPPVLVAAPRLPAKVTEPSLEQLGAYLDGRATFATGAPVTDCPFPSDDEDGLFVLWIRGWVRAQTEATRARVAGEGLWVDPDAERLSWTEEGGLLITPPLPPGPLDRFVAGPADLTVDLPTDAAASGDTVTAAGSGPGAPSATEGRRMPRTWKSAPHLAPFDTPTGDGRIFKVGSLTARELPLPLLFQPASGMGHDGSVVVGRILAVNFTDAGIEASGDYLDADSSTAPDLAKAVEQAVALTESGLGHVSVDLSDVVGELVDEDGNPVSMEDIFDAWDRGEDPKVLEQVAEGKLIACTQVATPAFEGAKIELSADAAPLPVDGEAALEDSAGEPIAVGAVVDAETDEGSIRGRVTAVDEDAESVTVQPTNDDGEDEGDVLVVAPAAITVVEPAPAAEEDPSEADKEVSLIAAAGPLRPPAAWFEDPKLEGPTAMTITDDGRVFGHVAVWGECHVGFSNTCVSPPTSPSGYKHFHVGEVVTEDGTRVAVGNLTLGGRHADVRLAYRSAIEHYDVSGAGTAVVRSGEDEYGIWFAGALTPGVTEEQIYDMRRSPVSGDWRRVGGELEMIGVLSVNSGGFNTPRFATDSAGRTALTAAPSVRPATSAKQTPSSLAQLTQRITADVTSAVRAQLVAERAGEERAARLRGLAAAVRPDQTRQRKLASLSAKVDRPRRDRLAELSATVTR